LPLVNGWDDYGGMNQYVRWRVHYPVAKSDTTIPKDRKAAEQAIVRGPRGQSYQVRINPLFGHDDFYSDSMIIRWYQGYVAMILQRTNTYTGVQFRDEQAVFGWELANEPRSSDRSCQLINRWVVMTSLFIKSIDQNHLVGTGEEGFDNTGTVYSGDAYAGQSWMFDGSDGTSFSTNSAVPMIDFASIHLYPGSWNIPNGSGNSWIRDHIQIARSMGKPLVVGEFGVRDFKAPTYGSWLTTALLDGAAGALVWQLLEGARSDGEGFGFRCPDDDPLCSVLRTHAVQFDTKSRSGGLPVPVAYSLYQNYPNPFNGITTIAYDLPAESFVSLGLYDILGHRVATLVDGVQRAGSRRELVDVANHATGAYFYRLMVTPAVPGSGQAYSQTRKLLIVK
jgi:endo-1,4-beta-mannosidase